MDRKRKQQSISDNTTEDKRQNLISSQTDTDNNDDYDLDELRWMMRQTSIYSNNEDAVDFLLGLQLTLTLNSWTEIHKKLLDYANAQQINHPQKSAHDWLTFWLNYPLNTCSTVTLMMPHGTGRYQSPVSIKAEDGLHVTISDFLRVWVYICSTQTHSLTVPINAQLNSLQYISPTKTYIPVLIF